MKVGIIIPALDAARFLPDLLEEILRRHPDFRPLVVDDGSSDGTGEVARAAGATVLTHAVNRGKGAALLTGFAWSLDSGMDWVYTMDADGQHLPGEMQSFLDLALGGELDVVVGSRMADTKDMPLERRLTNEITSRVVSWLAECPVPDSQSGYRLFRGPCLRGLRLSTSHYDLESEILVRLARRGCRIGAVPVTTVYGDETSAIRPLRDTGRFIRLVALLLRDRDS